MYEQLTGRMPVRRQDNGPATLIGEVFVGAVGEIKRLEIVVYICDVFTDGCVFGWLIISLMRFVRLCFSMRIPEM